ncbi:hypothetical protein BC938DRAFT_476788, partial [Jimgerdemannia flammicorona]
PPTTMAEEEDTQMLQVHNTPPAQSHTISSTALRVVNTRPIHALRIHPLSRTNFQTPRKPRQGSDASTSDAENKTPEPDDADIDGTKKVETPQEVCQFVIVVCGRRGARQLSKNPQAHHSSHATLTNYTHLLTPHPTIYPPIPDPLVNSATKKRADHPTSAKKNHPPNKRANPPRPTATTADSDDAASETSSRSEPAPPSPRSDSDDDGDDDPDFRKPARRGRGRPRRDASASAAKPSRSRGRPKKVVPEEEAEEGDGDILETPKTEVLDPNTSLETTVSEWVKTYRADKTGGMLELVNLLIHVSIIRLLQPRDFGGFPVGLRHIASKFITVVSVDIPYHFSEASTPPPLITTSTLTSLPTELRVHELREPGVFLGRRRSGGRTGGAAGGAAKGPLSRLPHRLQGSSPQEVPQVSVRVLVPPSRSMQARCGV